MIEQNVFTHIRMDARVSVRREADTDTGVDAFVLSANGFISIAAIIARD